MRPLPGGRGLSIFGRTFLLMVAALLIAEGIGLVLLITRPPLHNAPVRLSEVARYLSSPEARPDIGPRPPREDGGPTDRFDPGDRLDHGPPGDMHGPRAPMREWMLRETETAPQPTRGIDAAASKILQTRLAERLGKARDDVRVFVTAEEPRDPRRYDDPMDDPQLHEGFVAASRRSDGRWRIMESVVEDFPNAFQRQAMWLFASGLALLVPLAWLFARALAAPIRRFSEAARRLGTDTGSPPLQRDGPPEMLAAIDSFNTMQARINRLLQERAHMIGAIAHDLRTPLTRLAFRLDDLPSPLNEKVAADIEEMKLMISAALDFIRDRSLGTQRERLDFRSLVESVVDDQSDVGNDVTLDAGPAIIIEGDPLALRRMVANLVDNALKYGERARLRLRIAAEHCVLEIDDDGPGIPEHLQQRVFEPFFRAEASRNKNTGGIGLGLAAVRSIVLDHGGSISLQNRKGSGLRVSVELPTPLA